MIWQDWALLILCVIIAYLAIGIIMMIFLDQTPYALNPAWTKILLWPLYLWAIIF